MAEITCSANYINANLCRTKTHDLRADGPTPVAQLFERDISNGSKNNGPVFKKLGGNGLSAASPISRSLLYSMNNPRFSRN
jgi:hypothetical protein